MKLKTLVILFLTLISTSHVQGQVITVTNTVDFTFTSASILAGQNYSPEIESTSNAVLMSITGFKNKDNWSVTVNKSDANWDTGVAVYVKRTTAGTGLGTVSGGTTYLQVLNTPQTFVTGTGKHVSDINLQYKLNGISVELEATTFYTDIVYTLYEL